MSPEEKSGPAISPEIHVAELLDAFPELEEILIGCVPQFRKLKNPVLRNTIARVTTLRQAAKVGGIRLGDLVNLLRKKAGQSPDFPPENGEPAESRPDWFSKARVSQVFDAGPELENGRNPMGLVFQRLGTLKNGEIFELVTPFQPAPLIEKAGEKGYRSWSKHEVAGDWNTYFIRQTGNPC
ncbi:DUF1858 domain-containing protein [bacterium]|nr:DUF1858 domain-containing protein [bacterium]